MNNSDFKTKVQANAVEKKYSNRMKMKVINGIEGTIFASFPVLRFILFGFIPLVFGLLMQSGEHRL